MGVSVTLSGLCIIAVLPHILNVNQTAEINMLKYFYKWKKNIKQNNGGKCNFVGPVYYSRITSYIRLSIGLQK